MGASKTNETERKLRQRNNSDREKIKTDRHLRLRASLKHLDRQAGGLGCLCREYDLASNILGQVRHEFVCDGKMELL